MIAALLVLAPIVLAAPSTAGRGTADPGLQSIRERVAALEPGVRSELAREFLAACAALPPPPPRTLFRDSVTGAYYSENEARAEPAPLRSRLEPVLQEGLFYYQTRYGPILNYTRVFEILGAHGVATFNHQRLLDFGYGRIGHLRAIASRGATAVGVDIDPLLRALYSEPGDQGEVRGPDGRAGSVWAVTGWFPGDASTCSAVGSGFDLVISKNTLKGGPSPSERARQRRVVELGVSDSVFVQAIARCLKPGGLFLMYTISGPQGDPRCPFPEPLLAGAGFAILGLDRDDSPGAQAMMAALHGGNAAGSSVPDSLLRALYTLVRKAPERDAQTRR